MPVLSPSPNLPVLPSKTKLEVKSKVTS